MMTDQASAEPERNGHRVRVLIADDQPEHQEMIARSLEGSRHHARLIIVRAQDGRTALDQIRAGVDLAFLDIQMPGHTGLEVLAVARGDRATARIPVVIVSSSSDPRDVSRARDLGAVAYVQKGRYPPFRARIIEVIDSVLDGKAL